MNYYLLPANEGAYPGFWQVKIPVELQHMETIEVVVCCHFDDTGIPRKASEGTVCPDCNAVYQFGQWKLDGPPRLSNSLPSMAPHVTVSLA
jgi:hypothetical protein